MTEAEIDWMVRASESRQLAWLKDTGPGYLQVLKIVTLPVNNTPSRCALLEDGRHIWLRNVDPEDIFIIRPLFVKPLTREELSGLSDRIRAAKQEIADEPRES